MNEFSLSCMVVQVAYQPQSEAIYNLRRFVTFSRQHYVSQFYNRCGNKNLTVSLHGFVNAYLQCPITNE